MPSILLIDDDETLCSALSSLLSRNGNEVEVAGAAETAEQKLEQSIYDLVITDLIQLLDFIK